MPVIINELELIVEEPSSDRRTADREPLHRPGIRPIDIVRVIERERERRARLRAD